MFADAMSPCIAKSSPVWYWLCKKVSPALIAGRILTTSVMCVEEWYRMQIHVHRIFTANAHVIFSIMSLKIILLKLHCIATSPRGQWVKYIANYLNCDYLSLHFLSITFGSFDNKAAELFWFDATIFGVHFIHPAPTILVYIAHVNTNVSLHQGQ